MNKRIYKALVKHNLKVLKKLGKPRKDVFQYIVRVRKLQGYRFVLESLLWTLAKRPILTIKSMGVKRA